MNDFLTISPEVDRVLKEGGPVVALESTILAHGMPYPQNIELALAAERLQQKAVIDGT